MSPAAESSAPAAARSLRTHADRFEDLAALRSTPRPAAQQLRTASDLATRAHLIADTWIRRCEAPSQQRPPPPRPTELPNPKPEYAQ